jgi:hypothetical protein
MPLDHCTIKKRAWHQSMQNRVDAKTADNARGEAVCGELSNLWSMDSDRCVVLQLSESYMGRGGG